MTQSNQRIHQALSELEIELPSWGFANTGTRFGKFHQDAAAIDIYDKIKDAATVHQWTGACPSMAVHVCWDFSEAHPPSAVHRAALKAGIRIGSINPNFFQDRAYKLGSFGHPQQAVRDLALRHALDSIRIAGECESQLITLWFADGTNYPGQDSIRRRKQAFESLLKHCHASLQQDQTLLIEYKPFEPAFYQTDIADWGMAWGLAQKTGPQAKVLVDTGHHYASQNIEQIVAWLLDEQCLGGFHFNDRKYADDDLTLGSIDPYQIFRIFTEIHAYTADTGHRPDIAYMVDQSHNLKPKIPAMIQTVCRAQTLYAKAATVDFNRLRDHQAAGRIIEAEECLQEAFARDITGELLAWRRENQLPEHPLEDYLNSDHQEQLAGERAEKRRDLGEDTTHRYA